MGKLFQTVKALFQHHCFSSYHTACCELFLLKVVEYLTAFLLRFIGEKQSALSFEITRHFITVGFVCALLINSEGYTDYSVASHHKFGVRESLS